MKGRKSRARRASKRKQPRRVSQQRRQKAAARKRESELQRIEKALGEEFESLSEARRALKSESVKTPETIQEYEEMYEDASDFEDQGEYESGVDTGDAS